MQSPTVDSILVTFNRSASLIESCRSALAQTVPPRTIVVVDNNPAPVAERLIADSDILSERLRVVHPGANLGPPGGYAVGLEHLQDRVGDMEWVLLLDDDDPLPARDVVERLLAAVPRTERDRAGGIALMGAQFSRPRLLLTRPVDVRSSNLVSADALHGGAAPLYRATALREAGGFRPELFFGADDIDIGVRLKRRGWELYVAGDVTRSLPSMPAKAAERPGRPRARVVAPTPRDYYSLRNRIDIGMRYFPRRSVVLAIAVRALLKPIVNLPLHPVVAGRTLRQNRAAVLDGLRGRLGHTVLLDGETSEGLRPSALRRTGR